MEPMTLATSVVAMIVPYLARVAGRLADHVGDDLSEELRSRVERLYESVKVRMAGDRFAEPALERLEEKPDSQVRQAALTEVLGELVETDPSFASVLTRLVEDIRQAGGPTLTRIDDAGAVAVHGDIGLFGINVAGRDLKIGDQQLPADLGE